MTIFILKYTDEYDGHVWGHYSTRELAESALSALVSQRSALGYQLEIREAKLDPPDFELASRVRSIWS